MKHFKIISVDLAKGVFEVAVANRCYRITERRRLSRSQFSRFRASQAPRWYGSAPGRRLKFNVPFKVIWLASSTSYSANSAHRAAVTPAGRGRQPGDTTADKTPPPGDDMGATAQARISHRHHQRSRVVYHSTKPRLSGAPTVPWRRTLAGHAGKA